MRHSIKLICFSSIVSILMFSAAVYSTPLKLISKRYHVSDPKQYYTIDVKYPYAPQSNAFNKIIYSYTEQAILSFKKGLMSAQRQNEIHKKNPSLKLDANSNYLKINYHRYSYKHFASIRFTEIYNYYNAANPGFKLNTINFDTKTYQDVPLRSIFIPDSAYLSIIALYARHILMDSVGRQNQNVKAMILKGTKPVAKNYQYWNLSQKGLLISFPLYQVAPYAFGPQEVLIPYSVFSKMFAID